MHGKPCEAKVPAGAAGFTYIGLLIAVVVLGVALSAVGVVWRTHAQREREQELLFIGRQFESAVASYYGSTGGGIRQYPKDINDLLEDKRWPEPKHHLRKLYTDPMTGAQDWTILGIEGFGITGIASSSQAVPLKQTGFPADEEAFKDAQCYCDWRFEYIPRNVRRRINSVPAAAD
jgi:type II secretory pathway pseudopilin PulG